MEIQGVYKMGGGIGRTICDTFINRSPSRGVRIKSKEGEIKLVVSIIVEYGVDIPKIADEVQESVKRAVEKMTGLILSEVNVAVDGVNTPAFSEKSSGQNRKI
jgi:uncharacterized alkaline shock family protein YloU